MSSLLSIKNLKVNVGEKEILHGIDLTIGKGETHVIMGPNGAGKSTLGNAVMGNPNYEITEGSIEFEGKDILEENATNRAKMGIYLSFQNPIEVPGISLSNFMRNSLENVTGSKVKIWDFRKKLEEKSKALNMDKE